MTEVAHGSPKLAVTPGVTEVLMSEKPTAPPNGKKENPKKDKPEKPRYTRKTPEEVMYMAWPKDRKFERDFEAVTGLLLPDNARHHISTHLSDAATNLEKVPITPELEEVVTEIAKIRQENYMEYTTEISAVIKEKQAMLWEKLKEPSGKLGNLFEKFLDDARKKDRKEEKKRRKKHHKKEHKHKGKYRKKDKHKSKKHKKDKEIPKKESKEEKEYEDKSESDGEDSGEGEEEEGEEEEGDSSEEGSESGSE